MIFLPSFFSNKKKFFSHTKIKIYSHTKIMDIKYESCYGIVPIKNGVFSRLFFTNFTMLDEANHITDVSF